MRCACNDVVHLGSARVVTALRFPRCSVLEQSARCTNPERAFLRGSQREAKWRFFVDIRFGHLRVPKEETVSRSLNRRGARPHHCASAHELLNHIDTASAQPSQLNVQRSIATRVWVILRVRISPVLE
jgi:hypothetical protein